MTRPPIRLFLTLLAIAALLALLVTLASGAWAPRVVAEPVGLSRIPVMAPVLVPQHVRTGTTVRGTWAYAAASHGSGYLAIPEGPGFDVTVCGPLDCLDRMSTDAGPVLALQRQGRIGDLSSVMFRAICGPLSAGLCRGSYTILGVADQHPDDPPEHPDDAWMRLEDMQLPRTDTL